MSLKIGTPNTQGKCDQYHLGVGDMPEDPRALVLCMHITCVSMKIIFLRIYVTSCTTSWVSLNKSHVITKVDVTLKLKLTSRIRNCRISAVKERN